MSYLSIQQLIDQTEMFKQGFIGIPSLAGPQYDGDFGWGWLTDNGFLGGHDDLMWPVKAAYLVLPFLISSRLTVTRVVDPNVKDDKG